MKIGVVDVAAGEEYLLAIVGSERTVRAWGKNGRGQTDVPSGLSDVIAVAAGRNHSLALTAVGSVVPWGNNRSGQANDPGLTDVIAIAAGRSHSLALREDGTVHAWGASSQTNVPSGLTAIAIDAGSNHSLALKDDLTVEAWGGNNWDGELDVPQGLNDVIGIAAGWSHNLALRKDGTVVAWGSNSSSESTVPSGLSDVVAIAAGFESSFAVRSDGSVETWGNQPTLPPSDLTHVRKLAAGWDFNVALTSTELKASCREDRVVLHFHEEPDWRWDSSFVYGPVAERVIMRSEGYPRPDGHPLDAQFKEFGPISGDQTVFVDDTVSPGVDYYYYTYFKYVDPQIGDTYSPKSNIVHAKTCSAPLPVAMDIAFIIDDTSSMESLEEIKDDIQSMIPDLVSHSGNDYSLSLVTTQDWSPDPDQAVRVRLPFSEQNDNAFDTEVGNIPGSSGGSGFPECTDEGLNTVVNALPESARVPPNEKQIGDFSKPFRGGVLKLVVIITDASPGGFNHVFDMTTYLNALGYADDAAQESIRINAILVGDSNSNARTVMREYAEITCGWYSRIGSNAEYLEEAILEMIYDNLAYCP